MLATNTSSLSITEMAADLSTPSGSSGFHFFNPVAVMPLLEIVRGEQHRRRHPGHGVRHRQDAEEDVHPGRGLAPSFIVNRLLGRLMGEVVRVVDEGTPLEVADRAFAGLAPMPPFVLLGLVGPAIALHNAETLHAAFPDRFYVSENLRRVVEAGKSGVLHLAGGPAGGRPRGGGAAADRRPSRSCWTEAQVRERVLAALAEEVRLHARRGRRRRPRRTSTWR